ncbi:MAG: hypothetical protein L6W00_30990 [Lentisphaeria bacterium]|nr:MAG: hypothetical protein L6W00_30990 [Lentisphaeria bacterium]
MAEPFNFELILMDFLKYMPEAKRHDYELMLRRCNFSDPADPMFPVMLFLLFFQDNLADRMEELTEEVKAQKTIPPTDHAAAAPERKSCWKIVVAVLMAVQLMLTVFGIFCLIFRDFPSQPIMNPAISHSSEIQKINRYWDAKLQYAQKGNFCMNRLDLIPEAEFMGAVLLILIFFLGLMALQIIWLVLTVRGLRNSEKRLDEATGRLHRNLTQQKKTEELMAFLNGPPPPVPPNTPLPDLTVPASAPKQPPVADDAAWNEKEAEEEPVPESPEQSESAEGKTS